MNECCHSYHEGIPPKFRYITENESCSCPCHQKPKTQLQHDIRSAIKGHYAPINGSEDLERAIFTRIAKGEKNEVFIHEGAVQQLHDIDQDT